MPKHVAIDAGGLRHYLAKTNQPKVPRRAPDLRNLVRATKKQKKAMR